MKLQAFDVHFHQGVARAEDGSMSPGGVRVSLTLPNGERTPARDFPDLELLGLIQRITTPEERAKLFSEGNKPQE